MAELGALKYPTFKTEFFALYVYGLCSWCQKRLKREKRPRRSEILTNQEIIKLNQIISTSCINKTDMKVDVLLGLQWGDEGKGK